MTTTTTSTLPLGDVYVTGGASEALDFLDISRALRRHRIGDDGDLCDEDRAANRSARAHGYRVISCYHTATADRVKFWVITEADRSSTTVLLPEEY